MSPFFAMLMSIIILKEKPNKTEWATLIVAFIGAVFIIRPSSGVASFKALIALYGGFGAGTAYAFVRRLGKKGERSAVIVFCFSLFSTMITLPFLVAGFKPMSGWQIIILSLAGISAAIAQFNITAAYQLAPAKSISVFDYTQVIFAAILAAVFLKDYPDSMSYIGYALIIGAAVIKWLHGLKKNA
jgi:drug/metabolite transporter (DMT)-like permease